MNASTTGTTSSAPTINGSSAAFIGLIVGLSLFVVISCVAIFWLLRCRKSSHKGRPGRNDVLDFAKTKRLHISFNPRSVGERISRAFGRSGWERAYDDDDHEGQLRSAQWRVGYDSRILDGNPFASPIPESAGAFPNQYFEVPYHTKFDSNNLPHSSSTSTVQLYPTSPTTFRSDSSFSKTITDSPSPEASISHVPSFEMRKHGPGSMCSMSAEIVDDNEQSFPLHDSDSRSEAPLMKWGNGSRFQEDIS